MRWFKVSVNATSKFFSKIFLTNSSKILFLFAFMFMFLASVSSVLATPMDITLIYPTNDTLIESNNFTLNYTVNIESNCTR